MKVAIVDYGSGNLRSAAKAFERMAAEEGVAARIEVSDEPETVARADRVVLPGVGAFADCRRGLAAVPGLEAALREAVIVRARPFLGICVGMQLMAVCGREFETVEGLGWIGGEVVAIEPNDAALKIPHMGWNEIEPRAAHPLLDGLEAALREATITRARPFLGICVGMQLMADCGREFETVAGLGWIAGEVVPIAPRDAALKIPHMGWNEIEPRAPHPLLAGLGAGAHAYFVHSYHLCPADSHDLVAVADYGGPLTAMVGRGNLAGMQFHPEKSQEAGLRLIGNFLRWRP